MVTSGAPARAARLAEFPVSWLNCSGGGSEQPATAKREATMGMKTRMAWSGKG